MGKHRLKIVSVRVVPEQVTDENMEKVCKIVNEERRSTVLEILPVKCRRGLENAADRREVSGSVPRRVESASCVCVYQELFEVARDHNVLLRVITADETIPSVE